MTRPFISCICPTYKRPQFLANAVRCFELQDYPADMCELIILDDSGMHDSQEKDNWRVISTSTRFPDLPSKFNAIAERARGFVLVPWEDDDVYLPSHLSNISDACHKPLQFFAPNNVYSTYNEPLGSLHVEGCGGRFHASWAFTRPLFLEVNGYTMSNRLTFDQELRARMMRVVGESSAYDHLSTPSYVYRWGNGIYHGSQAGDDGYQTLWDSLENISGPHIGELIPSLDEECIALFRKMSIAIDL